MKKLTLLTLFLISMVCIQLSFGFDFEGTLGTGLTTTSNPIPNTLSTPNPYPTPFVDPSTTSTAWTTQAVKMLLPLGVTDFGHVIPIKLYFKPSGGSAITYTICTYVYNKTASQWGKFANGGCVDYTGPIVEYVNNPGHNPLFFAITALSSGTMSIYYDKYTATGY